MSAGVGALVLAAGFSNRFGSIKLCARLDNGKTVFEQTLERIQAAIKDVVVVTRPELADVLINHCETLNIFDQAEKGMGATLAYGIGLMPEWDATLVCLADMPFIDSATYAQLAAELDQNAIVMPSYQGRAGNPVGFGRDYYGELALLSGDSGGRPVVQRHLDALRRLDVGDPAILYDIDTPDDLARLQANCA